MINVKKYNIHTFVIPVKTCRWYEVVKKYDEKRNEYYNEAFCKYCGKSDVVCLDDQCKICGEHEEFTKK